MTCFTWNCSGSATGGKRFSRKNPWIASGGFIKPARRAPGPGGSLLLMTCFLCAGSQGGSNKAKSALQCCNLASVSLRVEQSTATCVQNEIPSETRMEHWRNQQFLQTGSIGHPLDVHSKVAHRRFIEGLKAGFPNCRKCPLRFVTAWDPVVDSCSYTVGTYLDSMYP